MVLPDAAAQTTTDYDTDNDGLIEVANLARLNAIRWDLDGDGAADNPSASSDPDDPNAPTQQQAYAAAFPNASSTGCRYDHDDDSQTAEVACIGYELTAALDFDTNGSDDADSGDTYWNGGLGWDPIGYYRSATDNSAFAATFDGNNRTISNLYINRSTGVVTLGLFGYVGAGAEIRNVRLLRVNVTGRQQIGGLVGRNEGAITDSHASGAVTVTLGTGGGGLVGANAGTISTSSSTATVSGADSADYIGGLVGQNTGTGIISASYATGAVMGSNNSIGGLVGWNDGGTIHASYATGMVSGADRVGGLVGESSGTATITASYWDTDISGVATSAGGTGKTTSELKTPTDYTDSGSNTEAIYAAWNLDLDNDPNTGDPTTGADDPWDFGTTSQYPVLKVDFTGDGKIDADDIDPQRRSSGGGGGGGGGGGSSSKKSSGGGSRAPSPPPVPTRSPIIGSTPAATAMELAGDLLVLQRHDQPGVEVEVGVGWISRDGQRIITIGFVRDGDLGQTYAVVRREGDGQVVRRWIAPDSPLVYAVPWASVNTRYTFPVQVILAIPLDDQYPPPHMLMRRFDGGDDRILAYDPGLGQWRHVPDPATFQALGYYWCNVTAADAGFFDRITLGPPYPASTVPARVDYPVCQT